MQSSYDEWRPSIEAAGAGIATSVFGPSTPVMMSLSAARLHGAVPRAMSIAIVATPNQHRPIDFTYTNGRILFVNRAVASLDAELVRTELGGVLATGPEQTVLDLARRPNLGDLPQETYAAIATLWPRCDPKFLEELATEQRLKSALSRARQMLEA